MNQTDNNRLTILQAMQIGPQWLLRAPQADQAQPATAASMAEPQAVPPHVAALDWPQLQDTVSACTACGLCQGRAHTVFGRGDQRATWLFVGEGPGYFEDQQGQPFVGAAGRLLGNIQRALGIEALEHSYIANVVKCRARDAADKDRPPTAEEIAACLPYLERQIALIEPKIIVALGKTAAIALLGLDAETAVGALRGKLHDYHGIPLCVTYHPAYLLRKPAEKSKTWADLCLALKAVN